MATKIEDLDIKGLAKHTPDEVLDEVLTVAEVRYSFRDFYHRWEHQQWKATEIDFSKDKTDWAAQPEIVRENMLGAMMGFYQGEESVTRNLGPMLQAAPSVEQEIFLSTQIVDEARHLVFFERFFTEVVGLQGDVQDQLAEIRQYHGPWYSTLFFDEALGLDGRTDRLRANPKDINLYAEVVTLYHMILEAGLALLGQRFLLDMCRGLDVLPGFYEGFMAVTRDESRHVGGGVRILRELHENDSAIGEHILKVMRESIPFSVRLITPPDEDYDPAMIDYIPQEYLQSPQESHRYSMTHILKRLSAAGFAKDQVNDLGALAWTEFEKAIGEWEERTGGDHVARMFPDDHAKGPALLA
jgi:ribonucleoside-diphosphate reductase beta chain